MIEIHQREDCNGCNACGDICPEKSITFITDIEGFWYPKIDKDTCTKCGLCSKICPELHPNSHKKEIKKEPEVYAAYSLDDVVRVDSTSGGVFSVLANRVFSENGYVGGAVFNSNYSVSHIVTNNRLRLSEIRSSKYLQSNSEGYYNSVKECLKSGEKVLVCATPCQIAGLKLFLGKEYNNLLTCDFICRGVNSPKVFHKYMEMQEKQYKSKAQFIKFKDKTYGWHNFSMRIDFENGERYCKDCSSDLFFQGYLKSGNFARPSCYSCKFKGVEHPSDITLADFWGIENHAPEMDQDKGTSLVLINSEKGYDFFMNCKEQMAIKKMQLQNAERGNPAIYHSLKPVKNNREKFFNALDKYSFDKVARIFFTKSKTKVFFEKIKSAPIKILRIIKTK